MKSWHKKATEKMHRGPQRRKGSSSKNCFFNITFSGYVALHIYLLLVVASTCAYSVVTVVWSVGTCNDLKIRASSHPVLGARDDVCVCAAMTIWNAHLKISDQHTLHDFLDFWLVFSNLILNCCITKLDFSFFQRCFFPFPRVVGTKQEWPQGPC